ncbi:MAG: NrfD/PsrC family molybdoenzyme membrane anchor subunit [Desulfocapsaceae bacterium]|jgi:molybdopterin-containing oxidoreductase family membrane subunit|nr:NrfD/PsrC family molybdoenzyme membrane anchor subunit [Desulfocapsaceae bacterium]
MSIQSQAAVIQDQQINKPQFNLLLWVMLALTAIGISGGLYALYVGHHQAFGVSRGVPWGIAISTYAYFAIISTGLCALAALSHLFGGNNLAPLANRMVWLSIAAILAAFLVIGLEIENVWRMPLGVILHPNPTSNIWWMGTLYGMAVGIMLVELYLIIVRRYKLAVILGVCAAVTELLANSNLGSVFASLNARPFWYGSQLPIFFLASAFLSGAAAIVLFTHGAYALRKQPVRGKTFEGMQTAGKVMALMVFLIGIATAWKFLNAFVGSEAVESAAKLLTTGSMSTSFWLFEIGIGLAFPFVLLIMTRLQSIQALSAAALMILVGQFFARLNLVVAGQLIPVYDGYVGVPEQLSYAPTAPELAVVLSGVGLVGVCFLVGEYFLGDRFTHHDEEH